MRRRWESLGVSRAAQRAERAQIKGAEHARSRMVITGHEDMSFLRVGQRGRLLEPCGMLPHRKKVVPRFGHLSLIDKSLA